MLTKLKSSNYFVKLNFEFEDQDKFYIGFEYCPGGELFNLIKKQRGLGIKLTKFYAACVVNALDFMHQQGVIYKDLKPENVVISKDGMAKLTDFGLCLHSFEPQSKEFRARIPTLHISAPEVLLENNFSQASDWWSFGCLIFEMIVGEAPFEGLSNF